jgi:hypothetical protein
MNQVNTNATTHIPKAVHRLASSKIPLSTVKTCNEIVVIALIAPEITDVVINAVMKRKKLAAPANIIQIACKFRACLQSNTIGIQSSNAKISAAPPNATLNINKGGDKTEFVNELAKLVIMSGSTLGAPSPFVEQVKVVALSLKHVP